MEVVIPASFGYYNDGTLHNYLTTNRRSGMNKPELSESFAYTNGCYAISNVWADTTNKKHRITIYNKGGARNMVDIEVVTTGNHEFSIEMGKVYKIPFGKTIGGKTDKDRYGPYNGVVDIWGFGEIPTNPGPQINPKSHRRLIEDNLGMINTLVKKTNIINSNISDIQDSDETVRKILGSLTKISLTNSFSIANIAKLNSFRGPNVHHNYALTGTPGLLKCPDGYTCPYSYGTGSKTFTSWTTSCLATRDWDKRSLECQKLLSVLGCSGKFCRGYRLFNIWHFKGSGSSYFMAKSFPHCGAFSFEIMMKIINPGFSHQFFPDPWEKWVNNLIIG